MTAEQIEAYHAVMPTMNGWVTRKNGIDMEVAKPVQMILVEYICDECEKGKMVQKGHPKRREVLGNIHINATTVDMCNGLKSQNILAPLERIGDSMNNVTVIDELIGQVAKTVTNHYDLELIFELENGKTALYHEQECCEDVSIEEVHGDLNDLVGQEIVQAEFVYADGNDCLGR